jgi:hypothetical protein
VYRDPYAFRHVGFFLRLNFGVGYLGSSAQASQTLFTFDTSHGVSGDIALALGGAVRENLILAGEFWSGWSYSPDLSSHGAFVPNGGTLANAIYGVGPQLTWYIMPANVFVSVTPSLTWVSFSDAFSSFSSNVGFGTRFALGKEWFVAPHWGLGVSSWFLFSFNREGSGSNATWKTFEGGVGISGTIN